MIATSALLWAKIVEEMEETKEKENESEDNREDKTA